MRLIVHAPTHAALLRARRNIRNLLLAAPDVEVELVLNGEAVRSELESPDSELRRYLVICENSLVAANAIAPTGVTTTPVAVLHIAQRQQDGWAYLRA